MYTRMSFVAYPTDQRTKKCSIDCHKSEASQKSIRSTYILNSSQEIEVQPADQLTEWLYSNRIFCSKSFMLG